mmetsp:Transcript_30661/g.41163  ORF Transcript_30661/g.41163 Transcript_30661/m.41163 type:complete len:87 (-) Transcript_30661:451-711(-)
MILSGSAAYAFGCHGTVLPVFAMCCQGRLSPGVRLRRCGMDEGPDTEAISEYAVLVALEVRGRCYCICFAFCSAFGGGMFGSFRPR